MLRRRTLLPLAFAACLAAVFLGTAPPALSQAAPEDENIETADGVKLRARFYKAQQDKKNSCVLLLHNYQADPNKGGWDDLAKELAKAGYNVLRFDFRGHGNSKDVIKNFWNDPFNKAHVKGGTKNPPPALIDSKSFDRAYFPQLVNDMAAARTLLDIKNDNGQVNSSTIYIIGAKEMVPLGFLFLASEWHRSAKEPPAVGLGSFKPKFVVAGGRRADTDPAGRDYGGCVWLSPARTNTIKADPVERLVSVYGRDATGSLRAETPMLFIHGEKDDAGAKEAKHYVDDVMVANGRGTTVPKLEFTYLRSIKGTSAAGVDLLGKKDQLGTETMILEFLDKMEKERGKKNSTKREYTKPLQVQWTSFGVPPTQ